MSRFRDLDLEEVEEYVNSQTRDEEDPVTLVQRIGSRRVAHESYNLYDVWTEKGSRWWVISDPLNLYSQSEFNSIDQAFTYHLGVRALVYNDRPMPGSSSPEDGDSLDADAPWFVGALRRHQSAVLTMAEARDAEDFQAVGIRCRETLLAYVKSAMAEDWVPRLDVPPKIGNFKEWAQIFAEALATGKQRAYLKAVATSTWDLSVWLQHYTAATEWDAEIVLNATRNFLASYALAYRRFAEGTPQQCPRCDSYRVRSDEDVIERDSRLGRSSRLVCVGCGWEGEEEFEPFTEDYLRRVAEYMGVSEVADDVT